MFMKTIHELQELSSGELTTIVGGGFAYDAGFFLRVMVEYFKCGPGGAAAYAALYYRPA